MCACIRESIPWVIMMRGQAMHFVAVQRNVNVVDALILMRFGWNN